MKKTKKIIYHLFVLLFGYVMIYPLLWMVFSSFKDTNAIFRTAGQLIPTEFKFENYSNGWKGFGGVGFSTFFSNSFYVAILASIGAVFSSAFVAFGFARLRFKTRAFWFICMLISMMLPSQVIMIPQYILFTQIGWVGTHLPLIVPFYFGQAFFIFLIIQFIYGLPRDLDEAAKIDGCNVYGVFFRIVLPLIVPSLVTCAIFSFIWRWDDFMSALLYLNEPSKYTVSIALKLFSDPSSQSDWGAMFAMSTLSVVPVFLVFIFFQKFLVEGISMEGLKG